MQGLCFKHGLVTPSGGAPPLRRARGLRLAVTDANNEKVSTQQDDDAPPQVVELPKSGYFALADTKREVYSKAGEKFDPSKRPGRYKSDFIWNTDWQKALQMEESLQRRRDEAQARAANPAAPSTTTSGAVSFSRLRDLNSMDVDLSDALRPRPKPQQSVASSSASSSAGAGQENGQKVMRTVPLPRTDAKKLERTSRIIKAMTTTVISTKAEDKQAQAEKVAQEQAKYEEEKLGQRAWTAGFSALGAAITYAMYGREVAISYVLGALGGIVYLRLLGRTVDGMGAAEAGLSSAAAQPRLLIPLILALFYNRWNTLYAEDYDVHLNLLAILVGFLTYKIAVISRQAKEVMDDMTALNTKR